MSSSFSIYVLVCLLTLINAAFYDCASHLSSLHKDEDALSLIKKAQAEKYKFSSECLEFILKSNFFETADYLMSDYYPKTSIDTELIVRNVAKEIRHS